MAKIALQLHLTTETLGEGAIAYSTQCMYMYETILNQKIHVHHWSSMRWRIGSLSKWGRQRQCWEARKVFLSNPYILLSISLLWLPCMFLFSLKTGWKWSNWSLIWEQDGTNVSFISHIHVRFLSSVISLIVWPTLFCLRSPFIASKPPKFQGKEMNSQTSGV